MDDTRVVEACRMCGASLDPDDLRAQESGLCMPCSVASAEGRADLETHAPAEVERPPEERRRLALRSAMAAVSVLVAIAVVVWPLLPGQTPMSEPPDRIGFTDTDDVADECLTNLTLLEEMAEEGAFGALSGSAVCPASGELYDIEWAGDAPTEDGFESAACPTPEAHELSELSIEAGDEIPTARE